ncbi:YraN family protein [Candidatus Poribacteria bacterium]
MLDSRKEVGAKGEKLAAKFLKRKGYKIIQRNYNCKLGEIDIIAEQDRTIIFVEVKTRRTQEFGPPQNAITAAKRSQISKVALFYIREKKLVDQSCRFDVIGITFSPESRKPEIEHIENAFQLSRRYTY